jgi:hypothetical protein
MKSKGMGEPELTNEIIYLQFLSQLIRRKKKHFATKITENKVKLISNFLNGCTAQLLS